VNNLVLDNRETATVLWVAIVAVVIGLNKGIRVPVLGIVREALRPVFVACFACFWVYMAGVVWIGSQLSLWRSGQLKPTILWFVLSGPAMLFNFERVSTDHQFFRRSFIAMIGSAALIEFVMNLSVMNLLAEILLQPVIVTLSILSIVAASNERHKRVRKSIAFLLAFVGFSLLSYTGRQLYDTWHEVDPLAMLRQFSMPIWLSIGVFPFLWLLSLVANYEKAFNMINAETEDRKTRRRAKIALLTTLHLKARSVNSIRWSLTAELATAPRLSVARAMVSKKRARYRSGHDDLSERAEEILDQVTLERDSR
jgi:hypothetical protein